MTKCEMLNILSGKNQAVQSGLVQAVHNSIFFKICIISNTFLLCLIEISHVSYYKYFSLDMNYLPTWQG
jgi:hypothetical protein